MDKGDFERLRREPGKNLGEILPHQPESRKWRRRGNGLVIVAPLENRDIDILAEAPNLRLLYFERMPPAKTWQLLNDAFFPRRPEVCLMVCNWGPRRDDFTSLDFLDQLSSVRNFAVSGVRLTDANALFRHPGLAELSLGGKFSRRITLDFLRSHPELRTLGIGGLGSVPRGFELIAGLSELERFTAGQGFPTLSFLVPLEKLRSVALGLGANHDMDSLGRVPNLEDLDLGRVRLLADLSGLGRSQSLRKLRLDELRNVETVACVGGITTLESLWIVHLKGLRSLDGVVGHANLRELAVYPEHDLPDDEFLRLVSCKRLQVLRGVLPAGVVRQIRQGLPACRINPADAP